MEARRKSTVMFIAISGVVIFFLLARWALGPTAKYDGNPTSASTPTPTPTPAGPSPDCERIAGALAETAMTTLGYDDVVGFCRDDGTLVLKFDDLKRGQIIRTAALLEPLVSQAVKDPRTGPAISQVSKVCVTNGSIMSREERCFYIR